MGGIIPAASSNTIIFVNMQRVQPPSPHPPQVQLYNRHFYLRASQHQLRQAQYQQQIKQLANKPKITVSSYQILCEQLEGRLLGVIGRQAGDGDGGMEGWMDFMGLQAVVCQMCQIGEVGVEMEHFLSQLWLILGRYRVQAEIRASLMFQTLRILLDPYNLNVKESSEALENIEQFQNSQQNRLVFLREYPQLQQQTLSVSEVIKLWRKIRYSNPAFTRLQSKKPQPQKYTFKPQLNKKSQQLAQKSLQKYIQSHKSYLSHTLDTHKPPSQPQDNQLSKYIHNQSQNSQSASNIKTNYHDILHQRRLQKDYFMPRKLDQSQLFGSSRVQVTASPGKIREIVDKLYYVNPRKEDADYGRKQEQEELKLCTFSPKINKNYQSNRERSISPAVRGYDKQVNRLQKGRQQKEKKRQAYENLGRVRNFSKNYSKSPNRSIAPSFIQRDNPKLILQINIGDDRVQKLALRGDQNAHLVSKKFVTRHGLQQHMIQVLQALVQEQLSKL